MSTQNESPQQKKLTDQIELEHVKYDLQGARSKLRSLNEAIRLLASRIMANVDIDDNATHATSEVTVSSVSSFQESPELFIRDMVDKPVGHDLLVSADMMALENAAQMVQDHARLASIEAAQAVKDSITAQEEARYWKKRAQTAEAHLQRLEKSNYKLQSKKLAAEKKVLVKEVRRVRKELAAKNEESMWTQLESYVNSALSIHEKQLKTTRFPELTPSNSAIQSDDCEESSHISRTDCRGGVVAPYSPETQIAGDPKTPPGRSDHQIDGHKISIAQTDSFGSPITFRDSSAMPLCDPRILRSLALPSIPSQGTQ